MPSCTAQESQGILHHTYSGLYYLAMAASPVAANRQRGLWILLWLQRRKDAKRQRAKGRPQGRCPLPNAALYSLKVRSMQDGQRITVGSAVSAGAWSRKSVTTNQAGGWDT